MNKKERRLALATALQSAAADMVVVEGLNLDSPKTKNLLAVLDKVRALGPGRRRAAAAADASGRRSLAQHTAALQQRVFGTGVCWAHDARSLLLPPDERTPTPLLTHRWA